jgi:chemotaxis protein MotA
MKNTTIIGLFLGLFALIVGMILKKAPIASLVTNPAAIVIIFVGTAASIFMAFPMSDLQRVPKLFKILFSEPKLLPRQQLITMFMDWATITRREGLLALEARVEEIEYDFLKSGMRMIIDGQDQDFVRDVLLEDVSATARVRKSSPRRACTRLLSGYWEPWSV